MRALTSAEWQRLEAAQSRGNRVADWRVLQVAMVVMALVSLGSASAAERPREIEFCVGSHRFSVPETYLSPIQRRLPRSGDAMALIALWPGFEGLMGQPYPDRPPASQLHLRNYVRIFVRIETPDVLRRGLDFSLIEYGLVPNGERWNGLWRTRPLPERPVAARNLGERTVYFDPTPTNPQVVIWCSVATEIITNPICIMETTSNGLYQRVSFSLQYLEHWSIILERSRQILASMRRDERTNSNCGEKIP